MGRVFLGFSPAGRPMAVKVVYPELARERAFINRFRQEVAAARRVSGAYTAPVVDAVPANAGKWAMEDFGSYTQVVYPTTITVFNTPGAYNFGAYSDPRADSLINASVNSANPDAVKAEAAYLTAQQPALFQPNADVVFAWKKTLSGPPGSFANLTQYYVTPESWYFTS